MRPTLRFVVASAIALSLAGAAGAAPPGKISPGKLRFRAEYTYFDRVGQMIGVKIYDCNGWVLKWGAESGAMQYVELTPCP